MLAHAELGAAMANQLGIAERGNPTTVAAELMQPGSLRRASPSRCVAGGLHAW